jgi:sugar phosphate isomerase/epimerase
MATSSLHRRAFLRRASLLSAVASGTGQSLWSSRVARAIEPIQRNGTAKFKFSLAAYSYRDLLTSKPPKVSLEDFISDCAKMGLEGTELTSYYFPQPLTNEYLCKLKDHAFRLGLDISGTAVGNDFCHPPGEERDKQLQLVKRWVDNAAILGAPVIRIFSGSAKTGQSPEDARKLAVEGMEECCQYAGQHGVHLALENHGGLTSRADEMLELVRAVKSPWFGVNLDTGNFHGEDVYADLAKLAPFATNVQVKVVVSGPDGKKKPSNFGKLAQILTSAGYRGYIVLEFEEQEDPRVACPRYIGELRKAFS